MCSFQFSTLNYQTNECLEFIDVTDEVREAISRSAVNNGLVNIQSMHTTCAVIVNENEPLLIRDIKRRLEALAPRSEVYRHDDFTVRTVNMCPGECANGHAHCKAILLPPSTQINIKNGKIQLGIWQRIFFIELDRPRERRLQILIMGVE